MNAEPEPCPKCDGHGMTFPAIDGHPTTTICDCQAGEEAMEAIIEDLGYRMAERVSDTDWDGDDDGEDDNEE